MIQIVSLAGALLILIAYAGGLSGRLAHDDRLYVVLNLVGAAVLATVAAAESQWGFLLLEGVWTLASLAALVRAGAGRAGAGP
jgi:hypothetical protein